MKNILALVESRKAQFAQLPIFQYLQDDRVPARERLRWTPHLAPLALGFGDLWRDILRRETADTPLQVLINRHASEDENHWKWYISDMRKLAFLGDMPFSDSLHFLWNEQRPKTRQVCLKVAGLTYTAEPIVVLAAIEALEATANVVFTKTAEIVRELPDEQKTGLHYFGHVHLIEDSSHSMFEADRQSIEDLDLTHAQELQAVTVVEEIFACFTEAFEEIMLSVEQPTADIQPTLIAA
ncbi:hypothetical protein IQ266_25735 [filamentous cyanobacterium LEGE 11480]|uniref:Uncharacterized protein n=1 Tax=Romeriopsis navalis LEGE 11480 TaxID=2777977 RepID=A0A928VW51_9CYAN|nr:hypothetical protein [Romeriopsis navalis]MBE9033144.1 hypothetical protein [Romeriopsis navalis LEGE 11480]